MLTDLSKLKGIDFSKKYVTTDEIKYDMLKSFEKDYYNSLYLDLPELLNPKTNIDEVMDLNYRLFYFAILNNINGDIEFPQINPNCRVQDIIQFKNNVIDVAIYNNHLEYGNNENGINMDINAEHIRSFCNNDGKKEILKKYGLKVSGTTDVLVSRLMENLNQDQLNYEFPIDKSNFYLKITKKGKEFIDNNIMYRYFNYLPFNFSFEEYLLLCNQNTQYTPKEIIICLCYQNWLMLGKPEPFLKEKLNNIGEFNAGYKFYLMDLFLDEPEICILLYERIIADCASENTEEYKIFYEEYKENAVQKGLNQSTKEDEGKQDYSIAFKLYIHDHYDEAIKILEKSIENNCYSEDTLNLLYSCYEKKGDFNEVIQVLKRIVEKSKERQSDRLDYWVNVLRNEEEYFEEHKYELIYRKEMAVAIEDAYNAYRLLDVGKLEKALNLFEKSLKSGVYDVYGCSFLAYYYHCNQDYEKEREVYILTIQNAERFSLNYGLEYFKNLLMNVNSFLNDGEWIYDQFFLGDFYNDQLKYAEILIKNNPEKSIELLNELIDIDKNVNERVYYVLYRAYYKVKRYDDAILICDEAVKIFKQGKPGSYAWNTHKNNAIKKREYEKLSENEKKEIARKKREIAKEKRDLRRQQIREEMRLESERKKLNKKNSS